jgi:hypothetical protein
MSKWLKLRWRPAKIQLPEQTRRAKTNGRGVEELRPGIDCGSLQAEQIYKQGSTARFQAAVIFIDTCKPTGNCTDDELLSLAIARHKDKLKGSGLHYT